MTRSKNIVSKNEQVVITKKNIGNELIKRIETKEDMANATIRASHQFYMLIQSLLKSKYGFDDKELKNLNHEVAHAVEGLQYFEDKGLNQLSAYSLDQLADVTLNHYDQLKAARAGLELPTDKNAVKLLMKTK